MSLANYTPWAIALGALVIGGWTTVAAIWGKPGDTVSEHVSRWSKVNPMLPFALGVLVGHWFW